MRINEVNTMNRSALTGIIAMLLGVVYSYQAYHLPRATVGNVMAPVYFPLGLGVLMFIFGLAIFIQTWIKAGIINGSSEQQGKKWAFSYTAKLITFTSFISILYAILFDIIGYVFSTILFLGAILFVINGVKQWKVNAIVSVTFALTIYIVFSKLLGIYLPRMPWIEF